MKNYFYRIFPLIVLMTFLVFWVAIFILAMPSNYAKEVISNKAPRLRAIFGGAWKLFAPPNTYHDRVYFVVREIAGPARPDTIEVLENIALQKQLNAPFNQRENIIDHLVNNNVVNILNRVWDKKKVPEENISGQADSLYMANAISSATYNNSYRASVATLQNYSKVVLKENHIDIGGKELKILIKRKMIRPFRQMNDVNFLQKEILIFETPYTPANQ